MPKQTFSIRNLLLLVLVIALGVGWFVASRELARTKRELTQLRESVRFLDVEVPSNIAAVQLPELVGQNLWQWRLYVPDEGYQLRAAYDEVVREDEIETIKSKIGIDLRPGESIVSVALDKKSGSWKLFASVTR